MFNKCFLSIAIKAPATHIHAMPRLRIRVQLVVTLDTITATMAASKDKMPYGIPLPGLLLRNFELL